MNVFENSVKSVIRIMLFSVAAKQIFMWISNLYVMRKKRTVSKLKSEFHFIHIQIGKKEKDRIESIEMKVSMEDFVCDSLICLNVWNRFIRTWVDLKRREYLTTKKKEEERDEEWEDWEKATHRIDFSESIWIDLVIR